MQRIVAAVRREAADPNPIGAGRGEPNPVLRLRTGGRVVARIAELEIRASRQVAVTAEARAIRGE